jgi:hypothetical protein
LVTRQAPLTYISLMEYLDVLRRGGWVPDPADRVRVLVEHRDGCPARTGGRCRCVPRVVLCDAPPRARELSQALRTAPAAAR